MRDEIKIKIGSDTSGLDRGLSSARKNIATFAKVAATAIAAAGAAMVALTKRSMENIDVMAKQARSLGLTTSALQAMSLVAEEAGVSSANLSSMLGLMQRNIIELGKGTKAQTDAFATLGLSISNLAGLSADEQFRLIAESLDTIADPATRTATAMDIFGRSGRAAINMLSDYSLKVQEAAAFQEEFGVAVGEEGAAKVEAANDAVGRLKEAFSGLGNVLAVTLAPAINSMASALAAMVKGITSAVKYFTDTPKKVDTLTDAFDRQREAEAALNKALSNVVAGNKNTAATAIAAAKSNVQAAQAAYKRAKAEMVLARSIVQTQQVELNAAQAANSTPWTNFFGDEQVAMANEDLAAANAYFDKMQAAVDEGVARVKDSVRKIDEVVLVVADPPSAPVGGGDTGGGTGDGAGTGAGTGGDTGGGAIPGLGGGAAVKSTLDGRLEALQNGLMSEREVIAAWYEESRVTLSESLENELITRQQYAEAIERLEEEHQQRLNRIKDQGRKFSLQTALAGGAEVLGAMGSFNSKALKISKVFAAGEALISTYQGAAKELKKGTLGFVGAAAVIAKGMAFVAAIKGVSDSGAGGGAGGGAAAAGGGAASGAGAAPTAGTYYNVTLQGDTQSTSSVRDLMEMINDEIRNGGRIEGITVG